jgi:hypothetical protein
MGEAPYFRDIDNIPLGVDFRQHISQVLARSDIVLVIVGPRWVGGRGGQTRINTPADPVRIEVEIALRSGIPVVPILVGRTSMPKGDQLPDSLKDFVYRNGLHVDAGQDFDVHVERLIREMNVIFATAGLAPPGVRAESEIIDGTTRGVQEGRKAEVTGRQAEEERQTEEARKAEETRRQAEREHQTEQARKGR